MLMSMWGMHIFANKYLCVSKVDCTVRKPKHTRRPERLNQIGIQRIRIQSESARANGEWE